MRRDEDFAAYLSAESRDASSGDDETLPAVNPAKESRDANGGD